MRTFVVIIKTVRDQELETPNVFLKTGNWEGDEEYITFRLFEELVDEKDLYDSDIVEIYEIK